MKSRFKYILVIFSFILISIIVIKFPRYYFYLYDKKSNRKYELNKINLGDTYSNYSLSNDEKLEIIINSYEKYIPFYEEVTKEKYDKILNSIIIELKKIDNDLGELFEKNFNIKYDDLYFIDINRLYFNLDNSDSVVLRNINYGNDNIDVFVIMDIYDNTILGIRIYDKNLIDMGNKEEIDIEFAKYLKVDFDKYDIFSYIYENEVYFGVNLYLDVNLNEKIKN